MRRLLWATDIHLDHVGHANAAREFGSLLRRTHPKSAGLILTGDIAESRTVANCLRDLREAYEGPVYFVLGNHDYYRGHFRTVDQDVLDVSQATEDLTWLREGPLFLDEETAIAGSGGWYDARYGDPQSPLQLSDFMLIGELLEALDDSQAQMHTLLRQRADSLVEKFREQARDLLSNPQITSLIVATHVPPFAEAAWHNGTGADGTWAPYFASKATGDCLLQLAAEFPRVSFTTLCGHSHGHGLYSAAPNLTVYTGRATYGFPQLAGIVTHGNGSPTSISLFSGEKNSHA